MAISTWQEDYLNFHECSPLTQAYIEIYDEIATLDVKDNLPAFQSEISLSTRAEQDLKNLGDIGGKKILEIGPGWGHLALLMEKAGAQVSVADLVPQYMDLLREKISGKSYLLDIQSNSIPLDLKFDVIVMCDVLEHVFRPQDALLNAYQLLNFGGLLYLRSPVNESLISYSNKLGSPFELVHLRTFTKTTLKMEVAAAGFVNISRPKKLKNGNFVPKNFFARKIFWEGVRKEMLGESEGLLSKAYRFTLCGTKNTKYPKLNFLFRLARLVTPITSRPLELYLLARKTS